jgi:hypothetical protein
MHQHDKFAAMKCQQAGVAQVSWTPLKGAMDFPRSIGHHRAIILSLGGSHMSNQRYSPEFKDEAVRQVFERGYSVKEVSERVFNVRLTKAVTILCAYPVSSALESFGLL